MHDDVTDLEPLEALSWHRRLLAKAPNDPDERRVLTASFADGLGTGLFLPLSVIYLTRIVGLSPTRVGLGLTIAGCLAIVATPLAGPLLARFGARPIVIACFAVSACGFLAYTQVDSFATFIPIAVVLQFTNRLERPATMMLLLAVTSRSERSIALAWRQSVRNLAYAIGGSIAGLALLVHGRAPFDVALVLDAASYLVAGALLLQLKAIHPSALRDEPGEKSGFREVVRDRPYVGLALLNCLVALNDSILLVAMPLWIVTRTNAPLALTGFLFALNTALVVVLQVRTTRAISAARGIARGYLIATLAFVVACAGFALSTGRSEGVAVAFLAVGLSALTLGELQATAGEWFLSVELAPQRSRGHFLSVYKTAMTVQQAVGPALVTTALVHGGRLGWCGLAALLVGGSLGTRWLGSREAERRLGKQMTGTVVPDGLPAS